MDADIFIYVTRMSILQECPVIEVDNTDELV